MALDLPLDEVVQTKNNVASGGPLLTHLLMLLIPDDLKKNNYYGSFSESK
jgi:hypothetical protein